MCIVLLFNEVITDLSRRRCDKGVYLIQDSYCIVLQFVYFWNREIWNPNGIDGVQVQHNIGVYIYWIYVQVAMCDYELHMYSMVRLISITIFPWYHGMSRWQPLRLSWCPILIQNSTY